MDDTLLNDLGRSLFSLQRDGPGLDELLVPRQASSGENAGKPPSRGGPKLPLSVTILDQKLETEQVLGQWCRILAHSSTEVGDPPVGRTVRSRAAWLKEHILVLDEMPWGEMAAEQIIAQARAISDVVSPPMSETDPDPIEVGTAREVVSWARNFGVDVSRSTVRRWIESGEIDYHPCPDGRYLLRLADVLDRARSDGLNVPMTSVL